jgi:hypothetical protein
LNLGKYGIMIHMNTCNLLKVTNILPCILFNRYFRFISAPCTLSFDNHLPDDGHFRQKHVGGVLYIYKLLYFYSFAFLGINIVNYSMVWNVDNVKHLNNFSNV